MLPWPAEESMDRLDVIEGGRDFGIGRLVLSKHLGIAIPHSGWRGLGRMPSGANPCVVELGGALVECLLLEASSDFGEGRAALYVCPCGDPYCGALTVEVAVQGDAVSWSSFGWEHPPEERLHQDERQRRTGPFEFDRAEYLRTLAPYR